jgi:hypothetical protein
MRRYEIIFQVSPAKRYRCNRRYIRCAIGVGEYSWGLKVSKRSFLGVLRVCYEGLRSMILQSDFL